MSLEALRMPSGSDLQDVNTLSVLEISCRCIPILVDLLRFQTAYAGLDVENADRAVADIVQHIEEG
jgi:hypothetical protein